MSVQRSFTIGYPNSLQLQSLTDVEQPIPYISDSIQFANCEVIVTVSGTATSCTVQVQRSAFSPTDPLGPLWVPADVVITGDPATGILPVVYSEPAFGWWRLNVTTITGGYLNATFSGTTV